MKQHRLILKSAYFLASFSLSLGITTNSIAGTPDPTPPLTPAAQSPATQAPSAMSQPQVWNLKNADIHAVIQTVSMVTGKNFIVDPRVQGKVTFVSHDPMSPDELYNAFLSMLQVLNFVAVPSGNAIKIIPTVDANGANNTMASGIHSRNGAQLVVRVVQVNNVSAIQLIPALRPLMPQWASLTAYAPSNSIILASTAANINHLVDIIHHMDSSTANETIMVPLKNANAKAISDVITKLQSGDRSIGKTPNVSIAPDTVSNSILISGNVNNVSTMRTLIQKMDANANADNDLTKVISLKYLSAKKLAPVLAKIAMGDSSTGISSSTNDNSNANNTTSNSSTSTPTTETSVTNDIGNGKISVQPDPDSDNAIIIRAPHDMMKQLVGIIKKIDVKPQQVLVEAIIVRMDHSLLDQLGINWSTVTTSTSDGTTTTSGTSNTFALKVSRHGIGIIADGSLQALVQALKSNASTDILSTPSIVVLNGQKATISDGQNVGIVNREYQASGDTDGSGTDNGGVPFNTIERKDVALSLTVTPQISPNNTLRLNIKQEDDTLASTAGSTTTDSTNPTINTSKITTNVMVHSNDILVLGGLTDHQAKKNRNKIPVLGEIPLVGHLFSYTSNDMEKKDLMIFLKPIILNTDLDRRTQTMQRYHYMRQKEIAATYGIKTPRDQLPVLPNIPEGKTRTGPALPPPVETIVTDQG